MSGSPAPGGCAPASGRLVTGPPRPAPASCDSGRWISVGATDPRWERSRHAGPGGGGAGSGIAAGSSGHPGPGGGGAGTAVRSSGGTGSDRAGFHAAVGGADGPVSGSHGSAADAGSGAAGLDLPAGTRG